ncbi:MAG: class II glutamine amidotransferase [Geminicoccaceae bacterium]
MCRWLAYLGDEIFIEDLILQPDNALIHQSLRARKAVTVTNGDGFGVGWYDHRPEPGIFRDILPAWNDSNLRNIARQVRSRLFMAHVRASTGTATSRANCHPFASGRFLFMHNGQIGGYAGLRRKLEALLDDRYYSARLGSTDSELIFLMMFQFGLESDPLAALAQTIATVEEAMRDNGDEECFRFTAALADGERVFAWRHSSDDQPPSLYFRHLPTGTVIASEPFDDAARDWTPLDREQMLVCDGDVRIAAL